jgi:predicted outer membrane repeat protein
MADRMLSTIAWIAFSTVIGTVCFLLKIRNSTGSMAFRGRASGTPKSSRIGFCENGAGYGGAIISLAAFIENIPKPR